MMEENGVEYVGQLGGSGGTIQLALDALKEKKSSVDQVGKLAACFVFLLSLESRGVSFRLRLPLAVVLVVPCGSGVRLPDDSQ